MFLCRQSVCDLAGSHGVADTVWCSAYTVATPQGVTVSQDILQEVSSEIRSDATPIQSQEQGRSQNAA